MITNTDLLCFSRQRWDGPFQRQNHLMVRFARHERTFFVEPPYIDARCRQPSLEIAQHADGPFVCVPRLPAELGAAQVDDALHAVVHAMIDEHDIRARVLWLDTPQAVPAAKGIAAALVVYDCVTDVTVHPDAVRLRELERALLQRADLVFTSGPSLARAKQGQHRAVHAFRSGVDADHFARARLPLPDPFDQSAIPHPRLGYFGVIDERVDLELVAALADARPEWHVVMIGPVVRSDALPQRENLHWLGAKRYEVLPVYLAGWEVALVPFVQGARTATVCPSNTLEYLAGGRAVVATPLPDVIDPYGEAGVVHVADRDGFLSAIATALAEDSEPRRAAADVLVARTSWDDTWAAMSALMRDAIAERVHARARVGT